MAEQEGRFSRWSRLKTEALENEQPQLDVPLSKFTSENLPVLPGGEELLENELAGPAEGEDSDLPPDLPDIETLEKDSDYTPFLAEGVPEAIKKLALRKLWASDPVLANIDGLNDYDEDFTIIEAMKAFASEGAKKLNEAEDKISELETNENVNKENQKRREENIVEIEEVKEDNLSDKVIQSDKETPLESVKIEPKKPR